MQPTPSDDLRLEHLALDDPALRGGIFDAARPDNPFAGYTFVYVPYCTGDVHLGDATTEYSPELTVQHKGWVNGTAALTYLAEHFPDAAHVVVVGESAGAIAAPVYGGVFGSAARRADHRARRQLGRLPDKPRPPGINELWGRSRRCRRGRSTRAHRPGLGLPAVLGASRPARPRDRDVPLRLRLRRSADQFMQLAGADTSDLGATIVANEAAIEQAGVDQHSFTAPGTDHTVVGATNSMRRRSTASPSSSG